MAAAMLAFIAGLVTILNPCVLPLIPVLLGSAMGASRLGPVALAAGLVASFASFGFLIVAFGFQLGINEQAVRLLAATLLMAAGLLLLLPRAQAALSTAAGPLTVRANQALAHVDGSGMRGQFLIGLLLGLVWAPCVGPTLGSAIAAASLGENLGSAFLTFLAFALGVALSILLLAYGSRKALGGRTATLRMLARYAKPLLGVALLLVGLMVISGFDRQVEGALVSITPGWLIAFTTWF